MAEWQKDEEVAAPESGDATVFHRLDGLRREEAERILERAIRLSDDQVPTPGTDRNLSMEDIARVAAELGISGATVRRALREELREAPGDHEKRYRLLGPPRVTGRSTVEGTPDDVTETVASWMENEEGLRPIARRGDRIMWERDTHWATSLRLAAGSDATKALRGLASVSHRQRALSDDEQLVEIEADTRRVQKTAGGVGSGIVMAGIGGGVATAFGIPGGNDLLQFLSVAAPTAALGAGAGWGIAKVWISAVEKGVSRALAGVSEPDLYTRAERRRHRRARTRSRRQGPLSRAVDELRGVVDDFLDT